MVHQGFAKSWTADSLNTRMLDKLQELLDSPEAVGRSQPVQVLVTGHSLGGAVATLCAFDIATRFPSAPSGIQ